jgi:hypothetical protein
MSTYALITSAGLQQCLSAASGGPLIQVQYFVPLYDARVDPYVQGEFGAGPASAFDPDNINTVGAPGDTIDTFSAHGEVIWNQDGYELSLTDQFFLSAGGESTTPAGSDLVVNAGYSTTKKQAINLVGGDPLSTYISGSNVESPTTYDGTTPWTIYDAVGVAGSNAAPAAFPDCLFAHVDYSVVEDDSGLLRGSFKCRLADDIGRVKFNRIYLFSVQLDGSFLPIGDPVLFAEVLLPEPVVKTAFGGGGVDDLVIDFQLDINSVSADFTDIFYSTSGDYWTRGPLGLSTQEDVQIGHGIGNDSYDGKTVLSTLYSSAVDERVKPQLILQRRDTIGSAAVKKQVRLIVDSNGRLNIASFIDDVYAGGTIQPSADGGITLGGISNRFSARLINLDVASLTADNIQGISNGTNIGAATISATSISATSFSADGGSLGENPALFVSKGAGVGNLGQTQRLNTLEVKSTYSKTGTSAINTWLKPLEGLSAYNPQLSAVQHNTYLGSATKPFTAVYAATMSASNVTATGNVVAGGALFEQGRGTAAGWWFMIPKYDGMLADCVKISKVYFDTTEVDISSTVGAHSQFLYTKVGRTTHLLSSLKIPSSAGLFWSYIRVQFLGTYATTMKLTFPWSPIATGSIAVLGRATILGNPDKYDAEIQAFPTYVGGSTEFWIYPVIKWNSAMVASSAQATGIDSEVSINLPPLTWNDQ